MELIYSKSPFQPHELDFPYRMEIKTVNPSHFTLIDAIIDRIIVLKRMQFFCLNRYIFCM